MAEIQFFSHTLANGLQIIIHPDRAVQKAAFNLLYQVGSRDEIPSRTGFAHLFEHLMFRGSVHVKHFDTEIQRIGGECNAFTSSDITNYYETLPASKIEIAFWLESDRMLSLDFTEENLETEKSVVCEEFKQRYLNQPYGDAYMHLRALHYQIHPYQWMTIGKELSHIEVTRMEEVKDFFFRFYAPNNAILAIAGNVEPDQMFKLAEKWFGTIPARETRRNVRTPEPPQQNPRYQTVTGKVPLPMVYKAFHIPARTDPAYYAVDLFTDLLGQGKSSRLYQKLVKEKQAASSIRAFSWGLFDPGMVTIEARVAPGYTAEAFDSLLTETIAQMDETKTDELERIRMRYLSGQYFERTAVASRALNLAYCCALGDTNLINTMLAHYQQVALADIKYCLYAYFQPQNASTLYYLPEN